MVEQTARRAEGGSLWGRIMGAPAKPHQQAHRCGVGPNSPAVLAATPTKKRAVAEAPGSGNALAAPVVCDNAANGSHDDGAGSVEMLGPEASKSPGSENAMTAPAVSDSAANGLHDDGAAAAEVPRPEAAQEAIMDTDGLTQAGSTPMAGSSIATRALSASPRASPQECDDAQPSTMNGTLVAAVSELGRTQATIEQLRIDGRSSVPLAEAEQWCESIAARLAEVGDHLAARLEAYQTKLRNRDIVIRRLHAELQALTAAGAIASSLATGTGASSSSKTSCNEETQAGTSTPASAAAAPVEAWGSSSPVPAETDDATTCTTAACASAASVATVASSSRAQSRSSVTNTPPSTQPQDKASPAPYRIRRQLEANSGAQHSQPRYAPRRGSLDPAAAERAQHAQLRREAANLRRRDVELTVQLRVRDAQVEQLKTMVRDLVQQRTLGSYARQLHVQDGALCALPEQHSPTSKGGGEASCGSASPAGSTLLAGPSGGSDSVAASRAPRLSRVAGGPNLVGVSCSGGSCGSGAGGDRRGSRINATTGSSGSVPVVPDVGASSLGSMPSRASGPLRHAERERSVSAAPHTPRSKLRDVVGHATRVAVETPAARRRQTSTVRGIGRSTSVEDRTVRRPREGTLAIANGRTRR